MASEFDDVFRRAKEREVVQKRAQKDAEERARLEVEKKQQERSKTLKLAVHASRLLVAHAVPHDATYYQFRYREATLFSKRREIRSLLVDGWLVTMNQETYDEGGDVRHDRIVLEPGGKLTDVNCKGMLNDSIYTEYGGEKIYPITADSDKLCYPFSDERVQIELAALLLKHQLDS
ncbi:MAG: hypothetical protein U5K77_00670 [Candidatus Saccharibacteria bacterium]|nr:hypothetical protein [Candidatus Saccharibacteria bacterium]